MPNYVFFPLYRTWQECTTAFLAHLESISGSHNTVRAYTAILTSFFSDVRKTPDTYTRADVEAFLAGPSRGVRNRGKPPSASTRYGRLAVLASFYRFAENWIITTDGKRERLLSVPPPTIGIAYGKRPNHHNALTSAELTRLFAAIPTTTVRGLRDRAILLLFFWTARRRAEIARLCYGDIWYGAAIDDRGHAHNTWLYQFRGKGQGNATDSAELPLAVKEAIDRYLEASGRSATIQPSDPLFTAILPGGKAVQRPVKPLHSDTMNRILKTYLKLSGLDPTRFSLHSLRHTSLREHYAVNPDIRAIQRLARHGSLQYTELYLGELLGTADTAVELLEKKYGKL